MAVRQYKRVYRIIYGQQDAGFVQVPFTLDNIDGDNLRVRFQFSRTNTAEPDRGFISIFNLPKHVRKGIKQDLEDQWKERIRLQKQRLDNATLAKRLLANANGYRVNVLVGYGGADNLELLFRGDLINVTEKRRGHNEIETVLELGDTLLALRDSYINQAFGPGQQLLSMAKAIIANMGLAFDKVSEATMVAAIVANPVITVAEDGIVVVGRSPEQLTEIVDLFGAQWWVHEGVIKMVPQGAVIRDFSIRLRAGEDLMWHQEESVGGDVRGRALLNANIHPGRSLILEDFDGNRTDIIGYRTNQTTSVGDTEGTPWYTDFLATGINSELIPPDASFSFEERTEQDIIDEQARRRAS